MQSCHSLYEFIYESTQKYLEGLFSLVFSIPFGSYNLQSSLSLEGRVLLNTSIKNQVLNGLSLSACVYLWASVFVHDWNWKYLLDNIFWIPNLIYEDE